MILLVLLLVLIWWCTRNYLANRTRLHNKKKLQQKLIKSLEINHHYKKTGGS
ncbi:hypothetical protein [Niallia nealsonii]|uniref:hypothetical protein n=1 Tax=Niallia nealsonii TaxID=115979 RepID=UPI0012FF0263|nr:hypothetical protein [Niallia nealsonii]